MKEAKNRGKRVKLVRDRLFINNEEYVPEEEQITLPAATSMNFKQATIIPLISEQFLEFC
jgi:hypothetical protein